MEEYELEEIAHLENLRDKCGGKEIESKEEATKRPFLVRFRSQHAEFRLPELKSLATLFGFIDQLEYSRIQARLISQRREDKATSPFLPIYAPSLDVIEKVASRAVGIQSFYDLIAVGNTFEELLENVKHCPKERMEEMMKRHSSFRYHVDSYGKKVPHKEQLELMEKVTATHELWEKGQIDLKDPKDFYTIFIDQGLDRNKPSNNPRKYYLGRKIRDTPVDLIERFNVKKRTYIGTTSMDSELSLMMANQALARKGTLVMDPFAGTGSLLLTCAHFGSMVLGGDIDLKMFNGWDDDRNMMANFKQYEITQRFIDVIVADNSRSPLRSVPMFHAILADPPYGIRAGARKVGKKRKTIVREEKYGIVPNKNKKPHIIQCINYSVRDVLHDLMGFAAKMLIVGGRLVYWLPTTDQFKESDLPLHPCLQIISNSEQPLSMRMRRRLITMEKICAYDPSVHDNLSAENYGQIDLSDSSHGNLKGYWMKLDKHAQGKEEEGEEDEEDEEDEAEEAVQS